MNIIDIVTNDGTGNLDSNDFYNSYYNSTEILFTYLDKNDLKLDFIVCHYGYTNEFYTNNTSLDNIEPNTTTVVDFIDSKYPILAWLQGSDTTSQDLSYNVVVSNAAGKIFYHSEGFMNGSAIKYNNCQINMGRSGLETNIQLGDMPPDAYYFGIQTVDNGFAKSDWFTGTFTHDNFTVHNVTQDVWYIGIQLAVDEAMDGDYILVYSNTYAENVNIDGFNGLEITGFDYIDNGTWTAVLDGVSDVGNGLSIINSSDVIINGLLFQDYDNGVYLDTAQNNSIINSYFSNNGTYGVYLLNDTTENSISNVYCEESGSYGIYLGSDTADFNRIVNCVTWLGSEGVAIELGDYNVIRDCESYSNNYGIDFWNGATYNGATNNIVWQNDYCGFNISYIDSEYNLLVSNEAYGDIQNSGIRLRNTQNNYARDNYCHHNERDGFDLYDTVDYCQIINNTIVSNPTYGIWIEPDSVSNLFISNIIYNTTHGIYFDDSDENDIVRNRIYNIETNGIYSTGTSINNYYIHNTLYNCQDTGIYFDSSSTGFITNNIFSGMPNYGINDASSGTIYGDYNLFYNTGTDHNISHGSSIWNTDPLLNLTTLTLSGSSSAVNNGTETVYSLPYRGPGPDLGWYESAYDDYVNVHNVTQDWWYNTIQDAVDAALTGDRIRVYPGIYSENIYISNLSGIILESADWWSNTDNTTTLLTTPEGHSGTNVIIVDSENTRIQGFDFTNARYQIKYRGDCDNLEFVNNQVKYNYENCLNFDENGSYNNARIVSNYFDGEQYTSEAIWVSSGMTNGYFYSNKIVNFWYGGIYFAGSSQFVTITNNTGFVLLKGLKIE